MINFGGCSMNIPKESKRAVESLEPQALWNYFLEISCIPRESGNERGIREYLVQFAKEHGIQAFVDKTGNVILKTAASKGYEHYPSVALQGHMDMVCVKDPEIVHDFTKDPIILQRDGDWLKAKGTSLGADNGIAIAMILHLFTDQRLTHGPLEAILTITEETGLVGAFGLDPALVQSRLMINLDSEEEGVFYIGCAGGIEVDGKLPIEYAEIPQDYVPWELTVHGLHGGHSGSEIDKQYANAIECCARILYHFSNDSSFMISDINGGSKRNVIPSHCSAFVWIPKDKETHLKHKVEQILSELKTEYSVSDPAISIRLQPSQGLQRKAASVNQSKILARTLYITPNGVDKMSMTMKGLVETSTNLAIVRKESGAFEFITSHRSSVQSSRDHIAAKTAAVFSTSGATAKISNGYPSWTPNPDSPLARRCSHAWKTFTGKEPVVTAIHAGLECGIINSLIEGMDSVSLGPNLKNVHSTAEACAISSTVRVVDFLEHLLASIGDY